MKKAYIEIPEESWGIIFCYDFNESDYGDIEVLCRSFGMNRRSINRSLNVLSTFNSGMTVSSDDLRMSAMFIGKSSSMSQFWNTIAHECSHLVDAISSYYNVGCSTEDRAYLQGFIFQRIVEEIGVPV
jgi:hypothetical protein